MILLNADKRGRAPIMYGEMHHYSDNGDLALASFQEGFEMGTFALMSEHELHQKTMDMEAARAGVIPGTLDLPVAGAYASRDPNAYDDLKLKLNRIRKANPTLSRAELLEIFPDYQEDMPEGISEIRAGLLIEAYHKRLAREEIMARAKPGFKSAAIGFGSALAGGALDPVNLIPFAGQAAKINQARKLLSLAGIRTLASGAGRGALEGLMGNAVVDLMAYPYLNVTGADLGPGEFMADLGMGGVLGGFFGGAGRLLGQWRHNVHQAAMGHVVGGLENGEMARASDVYKEAGVSWHEAVANNPVLKKEMDRLASELSQGGGMSPEMAKAQAILMGHISWIYGDNVKADPGLIMKGIRAESLNNLSNDPNALNMAMYPSPKTLSDYIPHALETKQNASFYRFGATSDSLYDQLAQHGISAEFKNAPIDLWESTVKHINKEHPDIIESGALHNVLDAFNRLELEFQAKGQVPGSLGRFGGIIREGNGRAKGVVFEVLKGGKDGSRFVLSTFFDDAESAVVDWCRRPNRGYGTLAFKEKKLPGKTPAAPPVEPKPVEGRDVPPASATSDKKILSFTDDVNGDILGQVILEHSSALIRLLHGAGPEVSFHEIMHVAINFLRDMAAMSPDGSELKQAWQAVIEHLGGQADQKLSRQAEEALADMAVKYFRDEAINPAEIKEALGLIQRMLADVYDASSHIAGLELPPEAKSLFDRIMAKESEARILREEKNWGFSSDEDGGPGVESQYDDLSLEEIAEAQKVTTKLMYDELSLKRSLGATDDVEEGILHAIDSAIIGAEKENEHLKYILDLMAWGHSREKIKETMLAEFNVNPSRFRDLYEDLEKVLDFHKAELGVWEEAVQKTREYTDRRIAENIRKAHLQAFRVVRQVQRREEALSRVLAKYDQVSKLNKGFLNKIFGHDPYLEALLADGVGSTKDVALGRDSVASLRQYSHEI